MNNGLSPASCGLTKLEGATPGRLYPCVCTVYILYCFKVNEKKNMEKPS